MGDESQNDIQKPGLARDMKSSWLPFWASGTFVKETKIPFGATSTQMAVAFYSNTYYELLQAPDSINSFNPHNIYILEVRKWSYRG